MGASTDEAFSSASAPREPVPLSRSERIWLDAVIGGGAPPMPRPMEAVAPLVALGALLLTLLALLLPLALGLLLILGPIAIALGVMPTPRRSDPMASSLGLVFMVALGSAITLLALVLPVRLLCGRVPSAPERVRVDPRHEPRINAIVARCAEALGQPAPLIEGGEHFDARLSSRGRARILSLGITGMLAMSRESFLSLVIQSLAAGRPAPMAVVRRHALGALRQVLATLIGPDTIDLRIARRREEGPLPWWLRTVEALTRFMRQVTRPVGPMVEVAAAFVARDTLCDGDRVAARMVGIEALVEATRFECELEATARHIAPVMQESLRGGRFVRNYPALLVAERARHLPQIENMIGAWLASAQGGWRSSFIHPRQRLEIAARVSGALPPPQSTRAARLLGDAEALSVSVTVQVLREQGFDVDRIQFTELEEGQGRVDQADEARAALGNYLVHEPFERWLDSPAWPVTPCSSAPQELRAHLAQARERVLALGEEHQALIRRLVEDRWFASRCEVADRVFAMGYRFRARDLDAPRSPRRRRRTMADIAARRQEAAPVIESLRSWRLRRLETAIAIATLPEEPWEIGADAQLCMRRSLEAARVLQPLTMRADAIIEVMHACSLTQRGDTRLSLRLTSPVSLVNQALGTAVQELEALYASAELVRDPFGRGPADASVNAYIERAALDERGSPESWLAVSSAYGYGLREAYLAAIGRLSAAALMIEHRVLGEPSKPPFIAFNWSEETAPSEEQPVDRSPS